MSREELLDSPSTAIAALAEATSGWEKSKRAR